MTGIPVCQNCKFSRTGSGLGLVCEWQLPATLRHLPEPEQMVLVEDTDCCSAHQPKAYPHAG